MVIHESTRKNLRKAKRPYLRNSPQPFENTCCPGQFSVEPGETLSNLGHPRGSCLWAEVSG